MIHRRRPTRPEGRREDGYVLLTLLLVIALIIIAAATLVRSISFDIKRDREEEMIHRGVQYSRAIRAYYRKFGRYPTKLEDLESANNMRFLRKRYKDPITGKDFKLLHFGEVKLTMTGIAGLGANATPLGAAIPQSGPGGLVTSGNGIGGNPNQSPFGTNQTSFGANQTSFGANQTPSTNNSDTSTGSDTSTDQNQNGPQPPQGPQQPGANSGDQLAGVTFGGGPVVGVASVSKQQTIREFNHKRKYNEWQFVYDPATDRGGLITGPNQPQIQGFGQGLGQGFGQQGLQNLNGQNSNGFNNSPGLQGTQNNLNTPPPTNQPGTPSDPNNPPQQQ